MRNLLTLVFCWTTLLAAATVGIIISASSVATAQDSVRYYEHNGATIREARTKVKVPVQELLIKPQQQTYYRTQTSAQVAQIATPVRRPVTQYQWVPKWHDRWNLLKGPHLAYHLEPKTNWATTWQTTNVPVATTAIVPESRTVNVASPQVRYEEREQVTRTVVLPNRQSLVKLPSDLLRENAEAAKFAAAPFSPSQFAMHPRYARPVATALPATATPVRPRYDPAASAYASRVPNTYRLPAGSPNYSAPRVGSPVALAYDAYGPYGGVARLDGDLPRYSTNNPAGVWQARRRPQSSELRR